LHLAIERIRTRVVSLVQPFARWARPVNGPARQKHDTPHACRLRGFEKCNAGSKIAAAEGDRIVSLPAPIPPGQVVEGGMHEMIRAPKERRRNTFGLQGKRREPYRPRKETVCRGGSSHHRDLMACVEQALHDEPADIARATGDETPPRAHDVAGFSSPSGSGMLLPS